MPAQLSEAFARASGNGKIPVPLHKPATPEKDDEFLSVKDLAPVQKDLAERSLKRHLADLTELINQNKWEDVVALYYPVSEKQPELTENDMDAKVRAKVAFALGHLNRFDDAIAELSICVKKDPGDFHYHSSLAYTAYNSLFAAMNREIFLSGKSRAERVALAHAAFTRAQELRPDGVTNFYRQGMLFKKLERKNDKALPLFETAVANWDRLTPQERETRHQERKNFVKALYHLASCVLEAGSAKKAHSLLERCLSEDRESHYVAPAFKYFALGKICFQWNRLEEAGDALRFAVSAGANAPIDFVYELLARTYLAQGRSEKALETINRVPENRRKPYYRWTESDVHCALKDFQKATEVLEKARERDPLSRHKTIIRLAKIAYVQGDFVRTMELSEEACVFFREKWGNLFYEGTFLKAVCAYRLGQRETALKLANEIKAFNPFYPKLDLLLKKLK